MWIRLRCTAIRNTTSSWFRINLNKSFSFSHAQSYQRTFMRSFVYSVNVDHSLGHTAISLTNIKTLAQYEQLAYFIFIISIREVNKILLSKSLLIDRNGWVKKPWWISQTYMYRKRKLISFKIHSRQPLYVRTCVSNLSPNNAHFLLVLRGNSIFIIYNNPSYLRLKWSSHVTHENTHIHNNQIKLNYRFDRWWFLLNFRERMILIIISIRNVYIMLHSTLNHHNDLRLQIIMRSGAYRSIWSVTIINSKCVLKIEQCG